MRDELESLISTVHRRWMLWTLIRVFSIVAGAVAALLWVGAAYDWLWMFVLAPVLVWFFAPNRYEIPGLIDALGDHDGQLQCAYDHREQEGVMVVAQRTRALSAARDVAKTVYAPAPNAAWWLPVALLLALTMSPSEPASVVVAIGSDSPLAKDEIGALNGPKEKTPRTASELGGDRVGSVARPAPEEGREPEGEQRGAAGRKTGAARSGTTGTAQIQRTTSQRGTPSLVLDDKMPRRPSHASEEAIAEPARPFPSRYQSVISNWFNRRTE